MTMIRATAGLMVLILGVGQVLNIAPRSMAPVVAQAALSKSQIAEVAERVTVLIQTPAGHGSGTIIGKNGDVYQVLTAKHVIESIKAGEEADITTHNGKVYRLNDRDIRPIPQVDLAMVQFRSSVNYPQAKLGNDLAVKRGMNVYVAGYPLPGQAITRPVLQFTSGDVTASSENILQDGYSLTYTNNTLPGMSGGPVLNERAELVGIHGRAEGSYQSTKQGTIALKSGFNLAVPIRTYTAWVNKQPIKINTTATTAQELYISGERKYNVGDTQGALADLNQLIKLDPNSALAYMSRGILKALNQKDYQGALADYNQALQLDPQNADIYGNRAFVRVMLRDFAGATADADQAIRLRANYDKAYILRGFVKSQMNDYPGALADASRAVELNPNLADAWLMRATAKVYLQNPQGALADVNQALRINPKEASSYAVRAIAKALRKRVVMRCGRLRKPSYKTIQEPCLMPAKR
ncbi:Tetratricopeptide repeat-containing protein [Gloeomargarita lithophora Alchichica-D10]|uniref:Serine protease n=1 Tax=Gloeomargarita lithophora Alchichica-D10 TaxID=1188229 RepID=A0A1J0ADV1_9CYAN|nr:tetratricopeptide repeat-containing serine protease family protein [Gloeomargarita lithophora]APB34105.1 Tetratricopeptide repeat-containing protein [Gloeomargarita lithophora Alchichica-D10]